MSDKRTPITRRDFLDGVAISLAATATAPALAMSRGASNVGSAGVASDYPPILNGMRGSHDGSFEVAHALVMGGQLPAEFERVDEDYDLIVVGGGISGLTAAYQFRKKNGPKARILILDNHDDFGGHARRNEFWSGKQMLLGFGGSINLDTASMSPEAYHLLEEIGVDFEALNEAVDPNYFLANPIAPSALYLNSELYGKSKTISGSWQMVWGGAGDPEGLIGSLNLAQDDAAKLTELANGEQDYLANVPEERQQNYLRSTSYAAFLSENVGLSDSTAMLFEPWVRALFGVGLEHVSIYEAVSVGAPGLYLLGVSDEEGSSEEAADYRSPLFPDGNASVARLLVRKLIPEVAPGKTMQDLVTARFDYSRLDQNSSPMRIRLNSTAVNVRRHGESAVDVAYVNGGRAFKARGKHCILAGYNGMIPHLCPELPDAQKENLVYGVKVPFIWVNVLLKSGAAARQSGASVYQCPGSFFELVAHAPPVELGNYQAASGAEDPLVMFMGHMPAPKNDGSKSARELFRDGRRQLLTTSFSEYEQQIRKQLTDMFGANDFDAKRDIEAITVNRWSHGYAYEYMNLYDPDWEEGKAPHEIGRAQFGRISIANSDSHAYAYVQSAIDAAIRAVTEQTS